MNPGPLFAVARTIAGCCATPLRNSIDACLQAGIPGRTSRPTETVLVSSQATNDSLCLHTSASWPAWSRWPTRWRALGTRRSPPRFDASHAPLVRAWLSSSDSRSVGPGACAHDPASSTGVLVESKHGPGVWARPTAAESAQERRICRASPAVPREGWVFTIEPRIQQPSHIHRFQGKTQ